MSNLPRKKNRFPCKSLSTLSFIRISSQAIVKRIMLYRITAAAHISIAIYFHGHFNSVAQRSLKDTPNSGLYSRDCGDSFFSRWTCCSTHDLFMEINILLLGDISFTFVFCCLEPFTASIWMLNFDNRQHLIDTIKTIRLANGFYSLFRRKTKQ